MAYDWPGNLRELKDTLEQAFLRSPDGVIRPEALPFEILERRGADDSGLARGAGDGETAAARGGTEVPAPPRAYSAAAPAPAGGRTDDRPDDLEDWPEDGARPDAWPGAYEAEFLLRILERNKWNVSKTCKELNVARSTLYRWLRKHGIDYDRRTGR
jgi:transcriptional regulator of acetoin/glycerol metabolism